MADWNSQTGIPIQVISGYRTYAEQRVLGESGRPAADPAVSTHTVCPSQGADLRISGIVSNQAKEQFGRIVALNGLRWGGGSPLERNTNIPIDWNHVDLGARHA